MGYEYVADGSCQLTLNVIMWSIWRYMLLYHLYWILSFIPWSKYNSCIVHSSVEKENTWIYMSRCYTPCFRFLIYWLIFVIMWDLKKHTNLIHPSNNFNQNSFWKYTPTFVKGIRVPIKKDVTVLSLSQARI